MAEGVARLAGANDGMQMRRKVQPNSDYVVFVFFSMSFNGLKLGEDEHRLTSGARRFCDHGKFS